MRNTAIKLLCILIASQTVVACSGSVRDKLGLRRQAPDAFKVVSAQPLNVPPSFYLRPPLDKSEIKQTSQHAQEAKNILFEGKTPSNNKKLSSGEKLLLAKTDYAANPEIRDILRKDNTPKIEEKTTDKLLKKIGFYKDKSSEPVVDSLKERERILENQKNGEEITKGETPTASNKSEGIFSKIFGL